MSNFTAKNKIIDIIEHDSNMLFVINRFGIKLGFGDITVQEACIKYDVDIHFFLAILNVYHNDKYFPEKKFEEFKISDIINYLVETHQFYKTYIMPEIDRLFSFLINTNNPQQNILKLLEKIFINFKTEFNEHIEHEESIIFPLILELTEKECNPNHIQQKIAELNFTNIHSQFDDKIIDIKNILIKYLPPISDTNSCNAFAIAIFKFEKDLKDHSRIEDLILYPRVNQLFNSSAHVEQ